MEHSSALISAYRELALEKGKLPVSKTEVANAANSSISDLDAMFSSLEALQEIIWVGYLLRTLETLEGSSEYANYSVREKLLAYYFTLFEHLQEERNFVKLFAPKLGIWNYNPPFLKGFKQAFLLFVNEILREGIETGEIAERLMLGDDYASWHWPQLLFLLNKWIGDESEGHAVSDQAVEKAVNLGFDVMGRNVLDSAFEFAKFMMEGYRGVIFPKDNPSWLSIFRRKG
jgi:Tetracyclin repressor-like, C-terminal domain